MRHAARLAALLVVAVMAVGAAEARDRGGGPHPRFVHPRHHVHPFVFRSFFFLGAPVFAPVPVALYPATPYPAYIVAPIPGYPNCYQYQTMAVAGGFLQPVYGTACVAADGIWYGY